MQIADATAVQRHLASGLSSFAVPEPMSLLDWSIKHFYLSAESSYVEQKWDPWPFQRAILACISNDAIREVDVKKSARVGYTKILLAAICYTAEHRRRNQALWQPTDDDRDEFVKTELEPVLRDVDVMHPIFPFRLARHKDNTLLQKKFTGSMLHLRGGKAAKNYRRISVSKAYLDELSAFDNDVEKEGDPVTLARKRLEGATFPKLVCGSTPKLKGFCLIDAQATAADARYTYQVPCPHCACFHAITWGGKDEPHGFKWDGRDTSTVRHLCPHCGGHMSQSQYLDVAEKGRWVGDDGTIIENDGTFRNAAFELAAPHERIAFTVWTAYSPNVTWAEIVRDFVTAWDAAQQGDDSKLKAFWNTTRGEVWEGEIERTDLDELKGRAEPFALKLVPKGCLLLLAGCDTQDNRIEVAVWGFGRGGEMWTVEHKIFYGNPSEDAVWLELEDFLLNTRYAHEVGPAIGIYASGIDSGGHHSHAVYEFARKHARRRVYALRGRPVGEKHIKDGATHVDIDWRGKRVKKGVVLWHVGTNLAKDLLYGRLQVRTQGAGYVHISSDLSDEWFRQFAGEVRATRKTISGPQSRWAATRSRVETWDCAVYALWVEAHLELHRKTDAWWDKLQERVQPGATDDPAELPAESKQTPAKAGVSTSDRQPVAKPRAAPRARRVSASPYLRRR
jgi:phage terminase large subunit GpA-like protein